MSRSSSAVIGAGLSGLAIAYLLQEAGNDVVVLEKSNRPGGVIRSERINGFLCESAANSMLMKSRSVEDLVGKLGLGEEMIDANPEAKKRFLVKNGRIVPIPSSPLGGLTTPLYSLPAKLRLLREPFIRRSAEEDESVAQFVTRRMGPEFLHYGIAPMVSGIFAGNPDELSIRYAFPKVWNLEQRFGSLIGGALKLPGDKKRRGEAPYKSRLISFRDGLERLPIRLADRLGESLRLSARVDALRPTQNAPGHWQLEWSDEQGSQSQTFHQVVFTQPAFELPEFPFPDDLSVRLHSLPSIPHPPVTTLVLGFRREQVQHPLDGFGVLIPLAENQTALGAIFSSTLFPGRAPEGHVALMVFLGGATMPERARSGLNDATHEALTSLRPLLGIVGEPVFQRHNHWPQAIPQYNLGHGHRMDLVKRIEADYPGLHFHGNYRGGPGLSDVLSKALQFAAPSARLG